MRPGQRPASWMAVRTRSVITGNGPTAEMPSAETCRFVPSRVRVGMWFGSWSQLAHTIGAALVAYVALVVVLRVAGKRTLAKLNAFDLVVTVALGSALATVILAPEVSVADGIVALSALVAFQFIVVWISARHALSRRAVKASPVLVAEDGHLLPDAIRAQRLTPEEVMQAIRSSGIGGIDLVGAVVIETDGTLSVVARGQIGSGSALDDVQSAER